MKYSDSDHSHVVRNRIALIQLDFLCLWRQFSNSIENFHGKNRSDDICWIGRILLDQAWTIRNLVRFLLLRKELPVQLDFLCLKTYFPLYWESSRLEHIVRISPNLAPFFWFWQLRKYLLRFSLILSVSARFFQLFRQIRSDEIFWIWRHFSRSSKNYSESGQSFVVAKRNA